MRSSRGIEVSNKNGRLSAKYVRIASTSAGVKGVKTGGDELTPVAEEGRSFRK